LYREKWLANRSLKDVDGWRASLGLSGDQRLAVSAGQTQTATFRVVLTGFLRIGLLEMIERVPTVRL
jgi:hypothetical protein